LSLRNIILHIGFSYNYNLDLSQLDPLIVRPENWRYLLQHLFPSVGNLPLLWLVEAVALLCGAAFLWWQQRARQASN
ncbi:MAG: hypothetical protein KC413_03305, partial [Anaerolineales bacterium]|nr:hypothetical protein [Anaerolineales bacterium]